MARASSKTSHPAISFLIGLAAAIGVAAAHLGELDRRAELQALDFRIAHCAHRAAGDEIVHVDIDDTSLSEVGRWPWPRETLAGVIDVLTECGAKMIVLDIIMPEPQEVRWVSEAVDIYQGSDAELLSTQPPVPVFDDAIFAESLRRAPRLFLPMHIMNEREHASSQTATDILDSLRREMFAEISRRPDASLLSLEETITPTPQWTTGQRREILRDVYLCARSCRALDRFTLPRLSSKNTSLYGQIVPPLVLFARAVYGSGFVTFQPDLDGVVRRIPLLADTGGGVHPQLALAVARERFAMDHGGACTIDQQGDTVFLTASDGAKRNIPLDREGYMLIRWTKEQNLPSGILYGLRHLSAAAAENIWREKQNLQRNNTLAHLLRIRFLGLGFGSDVSEEVDRKFQRLSGLTDQLGRVYQERLAEQCRVQRAALYDPTGGGGRGILDGLLRQEKEVETAEQALAADLCEELRRPENQKKFLADDAEAEARAGELLAILNSLPARNRAIRADIEKNLASLRVKVTGKICLIGSTATGAADFVPTPIAKRTPGVVVHSAIVETILRGDFLRQSPAWANVLVTLLAGGIVSALAATRNVLRTGLFMVLLTAGYVAFNGWALFAVWNVWLVLVAPVGAMFVSFLVVTVFRQLTEERAKRHIRGLFAHAMSPALVDRLLDDPSLAELGGQSRELTCMFSDLAGFTPLTEQLGPKGTVRLLNLYFDRVTDVVQNRGGGYLNKFIGDGIFAFFGAPVLQNDHPDRAVRAAIDYQAQVKDLNRTLGDEFSGLQVAARIGIATGQAMVGNCGSTQRMDYTAIGDCVNLASRLEAANKYFGTWILISESTWRNTSADDLLARPLGRILVTGQNIPVAVWSVVGFAHNTAPQQAEGIAQFRRGIDLFEKRNFAEAKSAFERAQINLPEDRPTKIYLLLCEECLSQPAVMDLPGHESKSGKGVDRIVWPWASVENE